ncbi:MAG: hypothetical protein ACO1O6_08785 [Bacteroidota bacterium]
MSPKINKLILTSHISSSVGWFGAVAVFLVLAITGINSENEQLARSAYLAMELSAWYIIIPFCLISLITGISAALSTNWGLFKHYWIVVKLILTVLITILLMLHLQPIAYMAGIASTGGILHNETGVRMQLIADSGGALLILLTIITISVYKPWGRIKPRLQNKTEENILGKNEKGMKKPWKTFLIIGLILLLVFVIIKHILGGGMQHH